MKELRTTLTPFFLTSHSLSPIPHSVSLQVSSRIKSDYYSYINIKLLKKERDIIWAAAVAAYKNGDFSAISVKKLRHHIYHNEN
ncbi:hypothetical protein [aff. Roholtiella sp. LEGE 12411]|uniref:hypothetical protein n=1 Tax=aff. Roholtiella sp. LEGE 12411 TaxID=1828822 RepID=UPI0018813E5C|nr:hypothetical protein [aff. Roholtiella sp. LEGE 12411]